MAQGEVGTARGGALGIGNGGVATVTNSTFDHNVALGGSNNTAGTAPVIIGTGRGGGMFSELASTLTASGLTLTNNQAIGGQGAPGSSAGDGLGGGIYNDGTSKVTVTTSTITQNSATGGAAGSGGTAGQGIGGGVYFASGGTACLDAYTVAHIFGNSASTSNPDVFGDYTIC